LCPGNLWRGCTWLINAVGCGTWVCVCNEFAVAMASVSSLVSSSCSGNQQDITSATSVLNFGFCAQLSSTAAAIEPTAPTAASAEAQPGTLTVTVTTPVTITPSCINAPRAPHSDSILNSCYRNSDRCIDFNDKSQRSTYGIYFNIGRDAPCRSSSAV